MLKELHDIPIEKRTARFRTVIAFANGGEKEWVEGVAEGRIIEDKRGIGGFGYDPIFYYPPLRKTFAELDSVEKNSISHRGKALRNFCGILEKWI